MTKYFEYFITGLKLSFKERVEYKANFLTSTLSELGETFSLLVFAYIFSSNFELLDWTFVDFIILFFFGNLVHTLSGIFWYTKQINYRIKQGFFNSLFYLPGNRFFNYLFLKGYNPVIHVVIDTIIFLPIIIIMATFTLKSIVLTLLLTLLLSYFFLITFYFLDSFSWFFVDIGKILSENVLEKINDKILYTYPGTIFSKTNIKYVLLIMPMYFVATLIVPTLQNKTNNDFNFNIIIIITLSIIFTIVTAINWHYGLKRYEAFG